MAPLPAEITLSGKFHDQGGVSASIQVRNLFKLILFMILPPPPDEDSFTSGLIMLGI